MTRVLLILAAAALAIFILIGVLASALTSLTGSPAFAAEYHGMVHGALVIAGVLLGTAVLLAAGVWLLLSSHSLIPAVRSHWARRLAPIRVVSRTPRAAAHDAPSTQEGAQS